MSRLLMDVDAFSRTNLQPEATDRVSAFELRNHDVDNPDNLPYDAVSTLVDLHTCTYIEWLHPTSVGLPG